MPNKAHQPTAWARRVHLNSSVARAPVKQDLWSESSKRSTIYEDAPSHYEDVHYQCWRCSQAAVFTAAEQKTAYERRKAYIWQRRILCRECFAERQQIECGLKACQDRWRTGRRELQHDPAFLQHWLHLLEKHTKYAGRKNTAGIAMLRRLIPESA